MNVIIDYSPGFTQDKKSWVQSRKRQRIQITKQRKTFMRKQRKLLDNYVQTLQWRGMNWTVPTTTTMYTCRVHRSDTENCTDAVAVRSHDARSNSCSCEASRDRRRRALPSFFPRHSCTRERLVPLLILLASFLQCYF